MNATEKDYELLENLGAKLHIATPTAKWGFKVEKDGVVLLDTIERAHSWTRNAYNLLVCQMCAVLTTGTSVFGDGQINIKTTGGVVKGEGNYAIFQHGSAQYVAIEKTDSSSGGYKALAGDTTKGIVVGINNTAYAFNDYKLAELVTNGVGTNQMAYAESTLAKAFDSVTKKYNVTNERVFNNNSATDIVIKEVGIIGNLDYGESVIKALVCRDILESPVTVPAVSKLTVSYTMSVQFPG